MTNLHFNQYLVATSRAFGPNAGLAAEMMFPGIGFGLDLGLHYRMLGATVNLSDKEIWSSQGYGNPHITLNYITLPIHLKFKYTNLNGFEDYIAPLVYAGPSFNFLVAHSDVKAMEYPGGEMTLNFGVGAEIMRRWQVSAAYNMGMTYCMKARILSDYSARNRSWSVNVTYLF